MKNKKIKRKKRTKRKKKKAYILTLDAFIAIFIFFSFLIYFILYPINFDPFFWIKGIDAGLLGVYNFSNLVSFNSTLNKSLIEFNWAWQIEWENGTLLSYNLNQTIQAKQLRVFEYVFITDANELGKVKLYLWRK